MVHIYYHIYAIEGVEEIIDEQLSLIEKHFDFPYTLNVGISIANENVSTTSILEKIKPNLRDVRNKGNEWTTLDLIRNVGMISMAPPIKITIKLNTIN